jgi:hypothetical protein
MVCAITLNAWAEVRSAKLQNREVWQIESPQLRVTITQVGGHVAELVLKGRNGLNPLWVQSRPTIEPTEFIREKHEILYGGGSASRLLSGLIGHNLCFPYWGDPSESEYQAGMTYHGETGIVRWQRVGEQKQGAAHQLSIAADLPESRTRFTRTISLRAEESVVYFENRAENLSALDRPVGWCEHVTVGSPFLKKGVTLFDASLTRGRNIGDSSGKSFEWPTGQAETVINLRTVRDIERSAYVNNFLVDPKGEFGYFTAVNSEQHLLLGYLFRRTEFPWLNVWEANQAATNDQPAMLARGLEFSNTPTHGSLKAMVAVPKLWDVPAYEWLSARGAVVKRFCAFSAEVPDGFKGVQEIRVKNKALEIVERDNGRIVRIAFDPSKLK